MTTSGDTSGRRWPDLLLGLAVLAGSGLLWLETNNFRKMDWEPLGMAFWPRVILAGLALVSLVFIWRGLTGRGAMERIRLRSMVPLACGAVFVLALPWLGFYAGGALLVAGLGWLLAEDKGPGTLLKVAVNALVTTLLLYLLFGVALGLRLPGGLF